MFYKVFTETVSSSQLCSLF